LNTCSFEVSDTISREVNDALELGLDTFNEATHAPLYKEEQLSLVHRDEHGAIVAGLSGKSVWDWLYVDMLWVEESLRGQGLGAALMKAAEEEAKKRGCVGAFVWTQSFHAPNFYAKLGYKEFVVMDDFPIGHQRIGFMKKLGSKGRDQEK